MTSVSAKIWKAKELDAEILKYTGTGYGVFMNGVWVADVTRLHDAKIEIAELHCGKVTWLQ